MDNIKAKGWYECKIIRKDGTVEEFTVDNLVMTVGKALITSRLGTSSAAAATYLALGSGTTAVAASQTALTTEITTSGFARAAATVSQTTTTTTNDTLQLTYTWTASGSVTVAEMGVFNASSSGTMLSRALLTSKSFVSGDTYQVTYKMSVS